MSRYPTIDEPTAPLDGTGLPYQRLDAPLAAFGGNDAAALGRLGDTLQQGVQDHRDRLRQQRLMAHESAANDALTQHRMTAVGLLRQYTGTRLQDAVEGYPAFAQALQGSRDAVLQDLSAPAQALLRPHLQRAVADALQVGLEHQQQQDHAWSDQSSLGALDADVEEAVLHRNDPARVQALADRGLDEWLKIGERKGWSDRDIGAHAARSRATLFDAAIGQHLADGNVEGAQALLGQARGQLDPATWRQMAQAVQAHSDAASNATAPDAADATDASNPAMPIRLAQGQPIDAGSGQPVLSDAGGDITAGDPQLAQLPDGRENNIKKNENFLAINDTTNSENPLAPQTPMLPGQLKKYQTERKKKRQDGMTAEEITNKLNDGSLGSRKYNIGNVRPDGRSVWDGRGEVQDGFETSISPEYGVRMNAKNLISYERVLGAENFTIANIAALWATAADPRNDPAQWARTVSRESHIDMDLPLDPNNQNQMISLMRAINIAEWGHHTVPETAYVDGVRMAFGAPAPTKTLEERRAEMLEIAKDAPKAKGNPAVSKLLEEKLREQFRREDIDRIRKQNELDREFDDEARQRNAIDGSSSIREYSPIFGREETR